MEHLRFEGYRANMVVKPLRNMALGKLRRRWRVYDIFLRKMGFEVDESS
jgi:hypothetical protein